METPGTFLDEMRTMFKGEVTASRLGQTISQPVVQQLAHLTAPLREIMLFNDPAGLYAHSLLQGASLLEP